MFARTLKPILLRGLVAASIDILVACLGKWRTAKVNGPSGPPSFVISSPAAGTVRYYIPDMKATAEGTTDGTDLPVSGPSFLRSLCQAVASNRPGRIRGPARLRFG